MHLEIQCTLWVKNQYITLLPVSSPNASRFFLKFTGGFGHYGFFRARPISVFVFYKKSIFQILLVQCSILSWLSVSFWARCRHQVYPVSPCDRLFDWNALISQVTSRPTCLQDWWQYKITAHVCRCVAFTSINLYDTGEWWPSGSERRFLDVLLHELSRPVAK